MRWSGPRVGALGVALAVLVAGGVLLARRDTRPPSLLVITLDTPRADRLGGYGPAHFNLGLVHEERGELQKAMAEYEAELVSNPKAYRASFNLAKALLDQGDLAGAEHSAREGLRVKTDPEITPLGHFVLADVFYRQGRPREAQQEAAKARRLQKEHRDHRGAQRPQRTS